MTQPQTASRAPAPLTFEPIGPDAYSLIQPMMDAIVRDQCYYALPKDADELACKRYWFGPHLDGTVVIARDETGHVVGSFYMRANQPGLGSHVANAGYMVESAQRGKGIAHQLCEESIAEARRQGFRAIQFNFVVSTNAPAIKAWEDCGFRIIGTIPNGYHLKNERYVDAHIMHREI